MWEKGKKRNEGKGGIRSKVRAEGVAWRKEGIERKREREGRNLVLSLMLCFLEEERK